MTVIDVSEATFQSEVILRSATTPVVLDFWAPWCGPCRQLTPVLEKFTAQAGGAIVLAKVDTDSNPGLGQRYGVQGIPAVKAIKDGEVVDEFVGVQGPAVVERFFARLLPNEADGLVEAGDEASLRRAVELEPGRADAALPLARLLLSQDQPQEALDVLAPVVGSFQATGLAARIRLAEAPATGRELSAAFAALDAGETEGALAALIAAVGQSEADRDDLRAVVVGVLDELGPSSELARDARRRLASALY